MAQAEDKVQPWRELYDKLGIPVPGELRSDVPVTDVTGDGDELEDGRFLGKRWVSLERGNLGKEKEDALADRVTTIFQGQPWYGGELTKRDGNCSVCGNYICTCQVFEGG